GSRAAGDPGSGRRGAAAPGPAALRDGVRRVPRHARLRQSGRGPPHDAAAAAVALRAADPRAAPRPALRHRDPGLRPHARVRTLARRARALGGGRTPAGAVDQPDHAPGRAAPALGRGRKDGAPTMNDVALTPQPPRIPTIAGTKRWI